MVSVTTVRRAELSIAVVLATGDVKIPSTVMVLGVNALISMVRLVVAHFEHANRDETTLSVIEFPFLTVPISREDPQVFVSPHRGIAAHGLIAYGDLPMHAAARKKVLKEPSDVCTLILKPVVCPYDPPSMILSSHSASE
jgi:hypothetical protein